MPSDLQATRRIGIVLFVVGLLSTLYFSWARYRHGYNAHVDVGWRREFPWPDRWLDDLMFWYHEMFPAPVGHFKMHGDLERVACTVELAMGLSILVVLFGTILFRRSRAPLMTGWRAARSRKWVVACFLVLSIAFAWSFFAFIVTHLWYRAENWLMYHAQPYWLVLVIVLMFWPLGPMPAGYCVQCGYDLRGSLGGSACPECGKEVDSRGSE